MLTAKTVLLISFIVSLAMIGYSVLKQARR